MIVKAALLKVQTETVALVMAPVQYVTDRTKGNNIVSTLQRLTFQGKPVVLVSKVGRRNVYVGRQDLVNYFEREDLQLEEIWTAFKDYSVNIPPGF